MQESCTSEKDLLIKSEASYFSFFQSLLEFICTYFSTHSPAIPSPEEQFIAEQLMVDSLLLTEKMHMHLFCRQPLYEWLSSFEDSSGPFCESVSDAPYMSLKDLKRHVQQHTFVSEDHQLLCLNSISQILSYYPQHLTSVEITISGPLCPPWKPPA